MIISRTKKPELEPDKAANNIFIKMCAYGLTKKAERLPTRDVNRDSGTASANRLIQFTTALRAFHKWFSGLGLLPHSSAFGLRPLDSRSNSFRAFPNRSSGSGDLLGHVVMSSFSWLHISNTHLIPAALPRRSAGTSMHSRSLQENHLQVFFDP